MDRHSRQRSGSPTGNPDNAQTPAVSYTPATEIGGSPAVWNGGDIAATLAPNAPSTQTAKLWYPIVTTIASGAIVNFDAGAYVERWYITQTAGISSAVYALPNGAGVGLPLFGSGVTLHLPIVNPTISVQNTGTGSVTIAAIAIAGYDPIEDLGYVTASDAAGGGTGSNVSIIGPVDGNGYVEVAVPDSVAVTGTFWQPTQPVSGTVNAAVTANKLAATLFHFQVTVATTQTALSSIHPLTVGYVSVKALKTNSGNVFIGATGVTTTTGDCLEPGDVRVYPVNDPSLLFCIGTAGDVITWFAS